MSIKTQNQESGAKQNSSFIIFPFLFINPIILNKELGSFKTL